MARRGNNIYHRKDGRWEGRFYQRGSRKYKSVYGRTYTEVREKLRNASTKDLVPSRTCHLKFRDIAELWLENRKDSVKISSYYCYKSKMDKHILPYFGDTTYSKLCANDLEHFKANRLASGYSAKYVADMVMLVKAVARYAAHVHHYVNPFVDVQPPRAPKRETVILSEQQQKQLIHYCMEHRSLVGICCFLTMFTGLRIGELCALKWSQIDLEQMVIHVRNTVQRIPTPGNKSKTAVTLLSPKSDTSVREIPLPEFLVEILKPIQCNADSYLVSGTKKLIEPRTFTNQFKALLKKADVPSVKFHSLRHTFATNFLCVTGDMKSLSEILGHASTNITMRIYIHSSMERKAACMEKMQALL